MAQSEEAFIRHIDKRFDWQVLETEDIGVWWHDRPESFGKSVFAIAKAAVEQQSELYQSDLDYQIVIIIYNDAEEFNTWQGITFDWIGGQALTSATPPETIAQIVATSSPYLTSPPKKAIDVSVAPDPPEGTPAGTEQNDVESSGICLFTPLLILGTIGYFGRRRKRSWR